MHLLANVYHIFEDVFKGKEKAKKVMSALEEVIVTTAIIFLIQNALEFI